ncbi:MAG: Glycoside hydrolase family 25 [Candidatus Moranbacteria bacterium GW2011_GWE1_35_17]|nr:MAG: Glycoside hydrolase family 25 [Candidatus Moranbacteria bacterium GW2011_GWE1_35_17]
MRRKVLWLVNLLAVMLLASVASAEVYTVKKGDTLSGIANKYGVKISRITEANNAIITNVNDIKVGWKLKIPDKPTVEVAPKKTDETIIETGDKKVEIKKTASVKVAAKKIETRKSSQVSRTLPPAKEYIHGMMGLQKKFYDTKNIGRAPTTMSNDKAFSKILLPPSVKEKLKLAIARGEGVDSFVNPGDQFLMTYGQEGVGDFTLRHHSQLAAVRYLIEDGGLVYDLRLIDWCKNWTRYREFPPAIEPPQYQAPPTEIPAPQLPPGIDKVIPPVVKAPPSEKPCLDNWDWYLGGGNYYSRVGGKDNNGGYGWTKYRNRPCPLWFEPGENVLGIKNVGLGFVVFLAGGDGIAAKYYDYNWKEIAGGVTAKVYAEHSDYDFDLMIGRLWNEGSWRDNKDRDQIDDFFLASIHANVYRDDPDALWLHKYELNAEGRFPFRTKMKEGSKVNNRVVEGTYTQWIYKFKLGEDDSLNLSPGFNFGLGYEWSAEEEEFIKIGPAVEFSSYGNVVAGASIMNYKTNNGGQWHPISGYVSIDGAYRAYEASQITSVSEEDLKGLENGSKLLANPADYL